MESPNLSASSDSDLIIIPSQQINQGQEYNISSRARWKSRRDCFEAYFCLLMSLSNGLQFGASIGRYGLLIFIPYIFWNIFVGIPGVLVSVMMSRYVMSDTAEAWNMCPIAKGVLCILFVTTIFSIINNFIYLVYLMKYFFAALKNVLHLSTCDSSWNTITCYIAGKKTNALNNCLKNASESFCMSLKWETSGTQFWKYYISDKTSTMAYVSIVICLVVAIFCLVTLIFRDIRSLEKSFVVTVILPIIIGLILAWVAFSTHEAIVGLKQIFTLKWKWLLHPRIWIEGLEDTLLFLGLGDLSLTYVSSHGAFSDDIFADVVVITFGGFLFNMFFMFPTLSVSAGSRSKSVIDEEYHLKFLKDREDVFISISDAIILYPFSSLLWTVVTYVNWYLIAVSSQSILVLAICDVLVGKKEFSFASVMSIFLVSSFFITICFEFFSLEFTIDLGSVALVLIVLFTITWQVFYGAQRLNYDFFFMMGQPLPIFIKLSWVTLLSFSLVALICKLYIGIPNKPYKYMCYIYVGVSILIFLIGLICEMAVVQYKGKKISQVFFANPNWGPENALLKKSRFFIASGNVNREFMYRQELNKKPFTRQEDFSDQNIIQLV